ncbi:hypothetical protein M0R45_024893 [Rubus argutus]|uniref:Uncharacterized protein n=1 Tax=Rubus argutus TaxID=59490 RepID=A0AAW1WUD0_RUBAR
MRKTLLLLLCPRPHSVSQLPNRLLITLPRRENTNSSSFLQSSPLCNQGFWIGSGRRLVRGWWRMKLGWLRVASLLFLWYLSSRTKIGIWVFEFGPVFNWVLDRVFSATCPWVVEDETGVAAGGVGEWVSEE